MAELSINYIKEKWAHAGFQKYFKNTGWMLVSRIICMIISFFTTIFVARNLGPTNYGQISYAVSYVGIFAFISSLGIESILYRDLIKYPEKKNELLGSSLGLKLFLGIITAIIIIMSVFIVGQDDVSRLLIFILSATFFFQSFQIIGLEFQAEVKSKYPAIINLSTTLILNILKILVIILGKGVIYLAFILLLEAVLYAMFYLLAYKIAGNNISQWKFKKEVVISILKDSWPLLFSSVFALIYSRIDQIFIKHMIDAQAVGIYGAAVTIAEAWYFIPGIVVTSLFPAIINAKKSSETLYYSRLKKLALGLIAASAAVSLLTTILAPILISFLYGPAFLNGIQILQVYVWSNIGIFLGALVTNFLITENYKKILFFVYLIPMLINVILNLIWIPRFGIIGAAYATLLSYTISPLMILFFNISKKKVKNILINN